MTYCSIILILLVNRNNYFVRKSFKMLAELHSQLILGSTLTPKCLLCLSIQVFPVRHTNIILMSFVNHHTFVFFSFSQCVQKPNQQVQDPGSTETVDSKELKLQDEAHKQLVETLGNCPSAHRAKRMKCEVGVFEATTHTFFISY